MSTSRWLRVKQDPFIGKKVCKYFPSHGWFEGRVVSRRELDGEFDGAVLYRVEYEDDDAEEFSSSSELNKVLATSQTKALVAKRQAEENKQKRKKKAKGNKQKLKKKKVLSTAEEQDIAAAEAKELLDLKEIASKARPVEFDRQGRSRDAAIEGLSKITLPQPLLASLTKIHHQIKFQIGMRDMVPWAGTDQDTTRLRGFGFLGKENWDRLDEMGVRLYAAEKRIPKEIQKDEQANRKACTVLSGDWRDKAEAAASDLIGRLKRGGVRRGLPSLQLQDLVALQPNLHNGANHLAAHLDWPRHEGFGKVICTVAIHGAATILVIGRECNENDEPPAWRFRLEEGDCYVLSGKVRNECLHGVLADDEDQGSWRESLNLRFGLHTEEEAENEIVRFWPGEL